MSIRSRLIHDPLVLAQRQLEAMRKLVRAVGQFTHEEREEATHVLNAINTIDADIDILRNWIAYGPSAAIAIDTIDKDDEEDAFTPSDKPCQLRGESL